ncbi:SagB family peptide dehydrogenase [Nonomuraea sp. NPDC049400]|uniref:SagB family peptide dehydrogenase n=1 Tax=Nonomuraea sp. NPDC049400 TaxID=3364352 RepID=UPI00378DC917
MSGPVEAAWYALWSFREDVYLEFQEDGLILRSRWEDVTMPVPGPQVAEALRRMCLGPISLENVITREADGEELSRILEVVHHLVVRSFGPDPEQALISVVPVSPRAVFHRTPLPAETPLRLSRFVSILPGKRAWRMESPLSLHRVLLHQAGAMALVGALGRPVLVSALSPGERHLAACLVATGMAVPASNASAQPEFEEDHDPVLVGWNPLDLMFHSRTTLGRHDHDFGATYRLGNRAVEPVVKPAAGDKHIDLPKPRWQEMIANDPPLSAVLEAANGGVPDTGRVPSIKDLGELLYRTVRVRSLTGAPDGTTAVATSDRPYRSAGDCYGIEVYVTVDDCTGLPSGVYHYDPLAHRLNRIADSGDELLENGRLEANLAEVPPVLLTLTARFRRLSWKYNGLSYALVLKDVGALTQTLSLVSTAMGLPTCALDCDDVDASSRVLGLDWKIESGVAGLVVGRSGGARPECEEERHPMNDAGWTEDANGLMR